MFSLLLLLVARDDSLYLQVARHDWRDRPLQLNAPWEINATTADLPLSFSLVCTTVFFFLLLLLYWDIGCLPALKGFFVPPSLTCIYRYLTRGDWEVRRCPDVNMCERL